MMEMEVETLQDLVQYINEHQEWPLNVSTIIKSRGWQDITGEERGVCLNSEGSEMVVINDKGKAEINNNPMSWYRNKENNKKVYVVHCNKIIAKVFDSPRKAFESIPQKDEFTEVYQTIRTEDGEETIIPTADNLYLGIPIYVHVAEHKEDVLGFQIECQEETFVYEIREFEVK